MAPEIVVMMILLSAPVAAKMTRMAHRTPMAKAATRMVPLETNNPRASAPLTPLETRVKAAAAKVCLRR